HGVDPAAPSHPEPEGHTGDADRGDAEAAQGLSGEEEADGQDQADQAREDQRGFRQKLRIHGNGQDPWRHGSLLSFTNQPDSLPGAGLEPAWGFPQGILSFVSRSTLAGVWGRTRP